MEVTAKAKGVQVSAQKARLVVDAVRGKTGRTTRSRFCGSCPRSRPLTC